MTIVTAARDVPAPRTEVSPPLVLSVGRDSGQSGLRLLLGVNPSLTGALDAASMVWGRSRPAP